MNLVLCPNCRNGVSPQAVACAVCGRPMLPVTAVPYAPPPAPPLAQEKQNVQIAYGLWAGSYLAGPLIFAAIIFAYVKRGEARGTYLAAHYEWLIETFWLCLWGGLGAIVAMFVLMSISTTLGAIAAVAMVLFLFGWPIYRLVKGWTALSAGRSPEVPAASPW